MPNYYPRGERVVSQLQAIGIQTRSCKSMERGVFLKRMEGGLKEWPGVQIIMNATRIGGTLVELVRRRCSNAAASRAKRLLLRHRRSTINSTVPGVVSIRAERKKLAEQIQTEILEEYYFVPVFRHAFVNAIGPRIAAAKWQDVFPTYSPSGYRLPVGGHRAEGNRGGREVSAVARSERRWASSSSGGRSTRSSRCSSSA